jgi:fluoride ion exporter CrcB/FEX
VERALLITFGGAIGTLLRYLTSRWPPNGSERSFRTAR